MNRDRLRWPDHEGHLGRQAGPERQTPYKPKFTHADLDRLVEQSAAGGNGFVFLAQFVGNLLAGAQSPIPVSPFDLTLRGVVASLTVAGTTPTVVRFYRSGDLVVELTIPTGELFAVTNAANGTRFEQDTDYMQFRVVSVGTGAAELVCEARF